MNYIELKEILREIKKTMPCQKCGHFYKDEEIWILGTIFQQGFFITHCSKCKNEMIINMSFHTHRIAHRSIKKTAKFQPISTNDILDMRNFLKQFNGDFSSLFSNSQQQ